MFDPSNLLFYEGCCSMDWKETPQAHIFMFDLPGLGKHEVKLQLLDHQLLDVIPQPKLEEDEGKTTTKWHCKERTNITGRRFRLPDNSLVDQITASMHDGVLVVTVPKDKRKSTKNNKKRNHAVQISGEGESSPTSPKGLGRFVCCKA